MVASDNYWLYHGFSIIATIAWLVGFSVPYVVLPTLTKNPYGLAVLWVVTFFISLIGLAIIWGGEFVIHLWSYTLIWIDLRNGLTLEILNGFGRRDMCQCIHMRNGALEITHKDLTILFIIVASCASVWLISRLAHRK